MSVKKPNSLLGKDCAVIDENDFSVAALPVIEVFKGGGGGLQNI
jgi:hypothetical protein